MKDINSVNISCIILPVTPSWYMAFYVDFNSICCASMLIDIHSIEGSNMQIIYCYFANMIL